MIKGIVLVAALTTSCGSCAPMPVPNAPVVREACPYYGTGSCYYQGRVYVAPRAGKFAMWHELAHALDAERLDDGERVRLEEDMGMSGQWNTGTGDHGRSSPNEWFADGYATCATHRPSKTREGMVISASNISYGFNLTGKRLKTFCADAKAFAAPFRVPAPSNSAG